MPTDRDPELLQLIYAELGKIHDKISGVREEVTPLAARMMIVEKSVSEIRNTQVKGLLDLVALKVKVTLYGAAGGVVVSLLYTVVRLTLS